EQTTGQAGGRGLGAPDKGRGRSGNKTCHFEDTKYLARKYPAAADSDGSAPTISAAPIEIRHTMRRGNVAVSVGGGIPWEERHNDDIHAQQRPHWLLDGRQ